MRNWIGFLRMFFLGLIVISLQAKNSSAENILLDAGGVTQDLKNQMAEKGFSVGAAYTIEYFANIKGGLKEDETYLSNLDLTLGMSTEQAGLWKNGQFFVYALENSGGKKLAGSIVGDLQTVSNIEAPRTMRIYELWYQHVWSEKLALLLGFHDYNSEFNVTEYGGLYLNSSFGIQPDISAGARPSAFPLAAPGVRLRVTPNEQWEFLMAVYDGDPGDPEDDEHFPRSDFDSEGGAFIAGEVIYHLTGDLPGFIKFGIWDNTGEFTNVVTSSTEDNNMGGYFIVDKKILSEDDADQGLGVFLQFGANHRDVNEVDMYIGGGINYIGLIPGRDQDEAGIAVAHARISDDVVSAGERDAFETTIETTYNIQISDNLRIQPDLQYITNPGAAEGVDNAFVVGIRTGISL